MNITYLIGAGASYEALPIVEKIPERLHDFAMDFIVKDPEDIHLRRQSVIEKNIAHKYLESLNTQNEKQNARKILSQFYEDIIWLKENSKNHNSIDTFAKKLFLKNDSSLKKLKYILSCFFLYEQVNNFDKRYDSFFASILESLSNLPSNLRIVSWNYDSQLEIAYKKFSNFSIDETRKKLNVLSKGDEASKDFPIDQFSVFKLNGTTSVSRKIEGDYDIIQDFKTTEKALVESFLEIYRNRKLWQEHEPKMSFAWEAPSENSFFKLKLLNSIRNTETLVIIGYSFPFFNRKMDKHILTSMKNLKKVYVQDPYHSDAIIEKVKGFFPNVNKKVPGKMIRIIDFIPKTFKDQFFIPIEF